MYNETIETIKLWTVLVFCFLAPFAILAAIYVDATSAGM